MRLPAPSTKTFWPMTARTAKKALAQLPVKRRVMEDLHLEPNGEESPWNRRMREIKDKRKK